MSETGDNVKPEWPKEILDTLTRAGPAWSALLGILLLAIGWFLRSLALEGAGIGVIAVAFLLRVSRKSSKLIRKNAFFLPFDYFIGRDKATEELFGLIHEERLIWVSGESGCGKSSLLRYGLAPRLNATSQYLPLYINTWGHDWATGPVSQISFALRQAVEAREAKLGAPPENAGELAKCLVEVGSVLHRIPVLILDQFDDYIAQNLERFQRSREGSVITAKELKHQNPFWRELSRLVERGHVRCVLVVRAEQSWGQAAVSFTDIREFRVYRLERDYIDQIFQKFGGGAIANTEGGWDALQARLKEDLGSAGGILPIEMRIVLRQLSTLKVLTVKGYERAGGSVGLAADYVKEVIERTASAASASPATVHDVLRHLVNPDDPSKTRDAAEDDLRNQFRAIMDGQQLDRVLHELKREEITLARGDETGARLWRLEHDYLARVIGELGARENRLERLLDRTGNLLRQPGISRKLEASFEIGPWVYIRIVWNVLRGRVRVRGNWLPLVVGAVGPCMIIAALAIAGYSVFVLFDFLKFRSSADMLADSYVVEELSMRSSITAREGIFWQDLSEEPLLVRQKVVRGLLSDIPRRLVFSPLRMRMAAAALGGLSPAAPRQFRMRIVGQDEVDFLARVFLASQFGQDAEPILREVLVRNHPIINEHLDR